MRESRRYLGLNLAGAKNNKTALAALEHYPSEGKIFLVDIFEKIGADDPTSNDQSLLALIQDLGPGIRRIGIDVPLTLPPCIECTRKVCPTPSKCTVPPVRWMREIARKTTRHTGRQIDLTPYTLRPIEMLARYEWMPQFPEYARFEVDEALGGTKGPLTARMHYLRRHLGGIDLVEVWPKLSIATLAPRIRIPKRPLETYRSLEIGVQSREFILEALTERENIFVYERDLRRLANNLAAFDAFLCAYTALLSDTQACSKISKGFPASSGWVQIPLP